jgi:DhnA family fructose-bisphosphate aldolase class Ia
MITNTEIPIPGDVPHNAHDVFVERYTAITRGTGRLFMFAADQKLEHLNDDFYGQDIDGAALDPRHIFNIAEQGAIGALATHIGLITRYGAMYRHINYIAKLNGKTHLVSQQASDPISSLLWDVDDAVYVARTMNIPLCGVGYTVYLAGTYEHTMLAEAARVIMKAHKHGLVAILWIYPRARHLQEPCTPSLIAGAAGVAQVLGADFVKVHVPKTGDRDADMQALAIASQASGNTRLICSGGIRITARDLIKNIADQLSMGRTSGCAIGRNIFQRSLQQALALTSALSALVYENASVEHALAIFDSLSE